MTKYPVAIAACLFALATMTHAQSSQPKAPGQGNQGGSNSGQTGGRRADTIPRPKLGYGGGSSYGRYGGLGQASRGGYQYHDKPYHNVYRNSYSYPYYRYPYYGGYGYYGGYPGYYGGTYGSPRSFGDSPGFQFGWW